MKKKVIRKSEKTTVICDTPIDFKYRSIFSRIEGIDLIEGTFYNLLKNFNKGPVIYHIRYIKYKNFLSALVRLSIIFVLSKLSCSKIMWTCHNISEHNIDNGQINKVIRYFLASISDAIIVFDSSLIKYLPSKRSKNIYSACFGDFKENVDDKNRTNKRFSAKYRNWKAKYNVGPIKFISLSAAKKAKNDEVIEILKKLQLTGVIISPGVRVNQNTSESVFVYNDDFVEKEAFEIMSQESNIIGLLLHTNISVPTSLYMYASLGIPVLAINIDPMPKILMESKIGEVFEGASDFYLKYKIIKDNYEQYKANCEGFVKENNWDRSAEVHKEVIKTLL